MWLLLGWLAVGLVVLGAGADLFVRGASGLALRLGISPFVVGLVVVGFGPSTPELAVNLSAASRGTTDIAIGNIVGSNIGWMANKSASVYTQRGYKWANLSTEFMKQGGGNLTIEEFNKAGVDVSVFNADDDVTMDYYIAYASKMKAICTNYPKKLLSKMGK